jgi:hypothetical protein
MEDGQDNILKESEKYRKDSRRLREIAALKATGKTLTGVINPTAISKKAFEEKGSIQEEASFNGRH